VNNSKTDFLSPEDPSRELHTRSDPASSGCPAAVLTSLNSHWYPWINDIIRSTHNSDIVPSSDRSFSSLIRSPFPGSSAFNPAFRLMDVWPMSIRRPDAHRSPPGDCLHWCMTGVMNYWVEVCPLSPSTRTIQLVMLTFGVVSSSCGIRY